MKNNIYHIAQHKLKKEVEKKYTQNKDGKWTCDGILYYDELPVPTLLYYEIDLTKKVTPDSSKEWSHYNPSSSKGLW